MPSPDPAEPLRRYLRVQMDADRQTIAIMRGVLRDIENQMRLLEERQGIGAAVRRTQIAAARAAIQRRITEAWARLGNVIETQAAAAALAAAEAAAKYDRAFLDALGLSAGQRREFEAGLRQQAESGVKAALNRAGDTTGTSRRTLSERVYQSRALAEGLVDRKITSGLARGLSAREMAAEVRGLIRPDVRGGVSYAAKRLARTEINNAFHLSQIRNAAGKPWVDGMQWQLSSSHPKIDICNNLAQGNSPGRPSGVYAVDSVPGKPHPHCLCTLIPYTLGEEEFLRRLVRGDFAGWASANLPR